MGRYSGAGDAKLTLAGRLAGQQELLSETIKFPETDTSHPQIQRMWAWRQVDERLTQLRGGEQSQAVIDQVVKLGMDYSIVTPFTAFLVLENESEYQRFSIERKNAARISTERQALDQQFAAPARRSAPRDSAPPAEEIASANPSRPNSPNHGGGGGAVEWLFLAGLGALAAGRLGMKRSHGVGRS
jgi:Ca-activated chloride channel family protein